MHELTLTSTDTMVDLARQALKTYESHPGNSDNDSDSTSPHRQHHSDEETTTATGMMMAEDDAETASSVSGGLKSVLSEPLLKKHGHTMLETPVDTCPGGSGDNSDEVGIEFSAGAVSSSSQDSVHHATTTC